MKRGGRWNIDKGEFINVRVLSQDTVFNPHTRIPVDGMNTRRMMSSAT